MSTPTLQSSGAEKKALRYIHSLTAPATLTELAQRIAMTPAQTFEVLTALEAKGQIVFRGGWHLSEVA